MGYIVESNEKRDGMQLDCRSCFYVKSVSGVLISYVSICLQSEICRALHGDSIKVRDSVIRAPSWYSSEKWKWQWAASGWVSNLLKNLMKRVLFSY